MDSRMDSKVNQLSPKSNEWLNSLNFGHNCNKTLDLKCKPLVIIKKLSEEQIQKYDKYFYDKHVVNSSQTEEPVERDIKSIEIPEFMRNLNLISRQELADKPKESLKQTFPLRIVNRIRVSVADKESIETVNRLSHQSIATNSVIKRGRKRKQTLEQRLTPKPKPKKAMTEEMANENRRRNRLLKFVSNFEFSSKLSETLAKTLEISGHSSREETKWSPIRYPKNEVLMSYTSGNRYNQWTAKNMEMASKDWELGQELSRENMNYCFTRRQRREQLLRRETALNWRSRLTAIACRPLDVSLQRLEDKPLEQWLCPSTDRQWDSQDLENQPLIVNDFDDLSLNEILNESMLLSDVTADDGEDVVPKSDDKLNKKPILIQYLSGKTIVQISCDYSHLLALTGDGRVYAWGNNYYGQIGCGDGIGFTNTPIEMTFRFNYKIQSVYCYNDSSFAITSDGRVFSWGENSNHRLGHNIPEDKFTKQNKLYNNFVGFYAKECQITNKTIDLRDMNELTIITSNDIEMKSDNTVSVMSFEEFREVLQPMASNSDTITPMGSNNGNSQVSQNSFYHNTFDELDQIGKGGFGTVFRVRHRWDGIVYAVKKNHLPWELREL
ncbi:unnamed protein product [Medioppia subpectinata]|uniref:Protein kinase domain-containing protein n=1 Tax=Medioppia subpectinata TaxID=1979941 RepID=A0A7R9Q1T4_9ACAR|nr:unnamed protein product [Medioppia subpectinata]CAG2109595.1 unnamed protein product [Medioppia subpectinata]